jgi:adenine phosphoribosyltransferase
VGRERTAQPAPPPATLEALTVAEPVSDSVGQPVAQLVLSRIRDVPDFPKAGVLFRDFTPLLADGAAYAAVVEDIASRYAGRVDVVVGIEARGFILGAAVAYRLGLGFVPVRKSGKLPGPSLSEEYTLEYGTATLELHGHALTAGQRVLVLDDVLATGGTVAATCSLVERAGAHVEAIDVVLELTALGGRARVGDHELHAIVAL